MSETLPMSFADAESCLRLTVAALSNVLGSRDRELLEQAMRTYARLCVMEMESENGLFQKLSGTARESDRA